MMTAMDDEALYRLGRKLQDREEYDGAFLLLGTSAQRGHGYAQVAFASMFWNGQGVSKSLPAALEWNERAAAQGVEEAIEYCKELKSMGWYRSQH